MGDQAELMLEDMNWNEDFYNQNNSEYYDEDDNYDFIND